MSRFLATAGLLVLLGSLVACGSDTAAPAIRNFDRPTDIAFACFGDMRVDDTVISSAQPLSSCQAHQRNEPPEGQEGLVSPEYFGFVLQPERGTVAVINVRALGVQDNDQLTPGLNDIPVGTLPVGMAEDASGCHIMVANAGSCDIAAVNVSSALDLSRVAEVNRFKITAPNGDLFLTRPRSIGSGPQIDEVGLLCPVAAQGTIYLTYPDCHMVAAVAASTGEVQSGLVFRDDGSVALATDEDYAACPVQCGDSVLDLAHGAATETITERPVASEISPDGTKLYVTSESSPFFTIVDLDAEGLPTTTIKRVRVEGAVGLLNFSVSNRVDMGGDLRGGVHRNEPVGEFQFAYAIATDASIRVLDLDNLVECDTQVDPRFLRDVTDVAFLSCMPVGDPRTPARRFGARGPGIQIPGSVQEGRNGLATLAVPLDIAIVDVAAPADLSVVSGPDDMAGTFAFATAATGQVYVINLDDDNYADLEDSQDPVTVSLPLALPHQLRDNVTGRDSLSTACGTPAAQRNELGARLMGAPAQIVNPSLVATNKLYELPFLQGIKCQGEDALGNIVDAIVTELSFAADAFVREAAFPDLRVVENQEWFITWEGSLSGDNSFVSIDGPPVRKGVVAIEGDRTLLRDASEPFCAIGVERFDIAALVGCDPLLDNDIQCGVGERCYVHPDSGPAVASGVCVPEERIDAISSECKDFFVSRRRYSVKSTNKGQLELIERRRVLRTSPLDGCESAAQCTTLADAERLLGDGAHPIEADLAPVEAASWACETDPSRATGVDRCVMTCETSDDCEGGFSCSQNRCVEALLPPAQCLLSVQRYQLLAGEAFSVLGADDGYLHSIVADPDTGACVRPADANPLAVGRIPLRPAPCDDDDDVRTGPNPCSTRVEHTEEYIPFTADGDVCIPAEVEVRTRETAAVRFSNPSLTFHMIDTETKGDLACRNDQAGEGPSVGTAYPGYQIVLDVGGGFLPKVVPNLEAALPIRIVRGPAGNLWILDQGDASTITRGRVFRINPGEAAGFDLVTIL